MNTAAKGQSRAKRQRCLEANCLAGWTFRLATNKEVQDGNRWLHGAPTYDPATNAKDIGKGG